MSEEKRDEKKGDALKRLQTKHVKAMDAEQLQKFPFFTMKGYIKSVAPIVLKQVKEFATSDMFQAMIRGSTAVYYLEKYIQRDQLPDMISNVPFICTSGDKHIVLQYHGATGAKATLTDGSNYGIDNLMHALKLQPNLISSEKRRLARNKVIVTDNMIYAIGGYPAKNKLKVLEGPFQCTILTTSGPQFEAIWLDFQDFLLSRDTATARLPEYKGLSETTWNYDEAFAEMKKEGKGKSKGKTNGLVAVGDLDGKKRPKFIFDARAYGTSMEENIVMYFKAIDDAVIRLNKKHKTKKKGYFKLTAIGTGFFADILETGINIGRMLCPLLIKAAQSALESIGHKFPNIGAVEFPDFSKDGIFSPTKDNIHGIKLVTARFVDVLFFSKEVHEQYYLFVLNAGDTWCVPGNELSYASVEAMLGNNGTMRLTQAYLHNMYLFDRTRYIGV